MKMKVYVLAALLVLTLCACSTEEKAHVLVSSTEELTETSSSIESDVPEATAERKNIEEKEMESEAETLKSEDSDESEVKIESSFQREKTTITFMIEGVEEEVAATVFEGKDYTMSIPEDGWQMIARECWASDVNEDAQFWVTDYAGENVDAVRESLSEADFAVSETDPYLLSYVDEDTLVWNVRLYAESGKTIGVFYTYPAEAEEGFGARLRTIVDTFTWIQE